MPKHRRTNEEITSAFKDQMSALQSSAKAYDSGELWEAKRLATSVYTLCFDGTGRTKSLLGLLNIRTKIRYLDTVQDGEHAYLRDPKGNVRYTSFLPLVAIYFDDDKAGIHPRYRGYENWERSLRKISFDKWWNGTIFEVTGQNRMTRKNLVFAMRTQDGGAHYDRDIRDESYIRLGRDPLGPISIEYGGVELDNLDAHLASMRQISWELQHSISQYLEKNPL